MLRIDPCRRDRQPTQVTPDRTRGPKIKRRLNEPAAFFVYCLVDGNISDAAKIDVPYTAVFHRDPQSPGRGHIYRIAAAAVTARIIGRVVGDIASVAAFVPSTGDLIVAEAGGPGNAKVECSAADWAILCIEYDRLPLGQLNACGVSS